ncbi:ferredoxin [Streptomyces caniscabiei]|uniref:ferredoxin n=1 Tax=Streptomyces caniscabiei TaxID=2746961 RepID=UPI0029B58AB2|nr:ferredoxin [Streptomyces caniscabiei]MDX2600337.1 ferredoxin [Streptomyces caniscabiei]
MKILLDRGKCTGLGICESMAPDVFEVDDDGALVLMTESVPEGRRAEIEAVVSNCPTEALRLSGE